MIVLLLLGGASSASFAYPLPPGSESRAARYGDWRVRLAAAERAAADGDWDSAGAICSSVSDEARALEDRSLLTARALDGLALARARQGRLDEAARLHEESVVLLERLLGDRQPRVAVTLHNLGLVYGALDRPDEARSAFERALLIFEQSLGADSEGAATSRRALAELARGDQLAPGFE